MPMFYYLLILFLLGLLGLALLVKVAVEGSLSSPVAWLLVLVPSFGGGVLCFFSNGACGPGKEILKIGSPLMMG